MHQGRCGVGSGMATLGPPSLWELVYICVINAFPLRWSPSWPSTSVLKQLYPVRKSNLKVERGKWRLLLERSTAFLCALYNPLPIMVFFIILFTRTKILIYTNLLCTKKATFVYWHDVLSVTAGRGVNIVASRYYDAVHLPSLRPAHLLCNVYHGSDYIEVLTHHRRARGLPSRLPFGSTCLSPLSVNRRHVG